jgi:hypothetical protein
VVITLWVLLNKITHRSVWEYAMIGVIWTAIAVGLDYVFIIRLLSPADGYYKLDVYLYYALTLLMPLAVGWSRASRRLTSTSDLTKKARHRTSRTCRRAAQPPR